MKSKNYYKKEIAKLVKVLPLLYTKLNFENHCYRRIAYDVTLNQKWNNVYKNNFVEKATVQELEKVKNKLSEYTLNEKLLLSDNEISLSYRQK